ncbi:MAG TPA: ABC transporter ATP-binding protein [Sediminibacterium sp.]|jgi:ABC-type multidrug transport system ATPase subunit|nr:ABC transporter ATP-binding protein [Sediminibacterium sp.]
MYCIETQNLSYRFSQEQQVLNKVNLQVPNGSIYGFLGPNGAGKTTTLRLILGLLRKQAGTISIFGKPFFENRISILQNIGSLIESPSLYGHLTAVENLRIQQVLYQCPKSRILDVLNTVGLSNTGKKKAGQFSLGMKQRLSIAVALLHNPSLLILDEPTNGLDPNGIIEIRDLIKKINRELNITILISSHLLSEIEKIVTHVGVINKGNILFQGKLSELQTKQNLGASIQIKTNNNIAAVNMLEAAGFPAVLDHEKIILPKIQEAQIAALNIQMVQQNIEVYQISHHQNDLESIFIDLINL